jgi:hypothetical protein
MFRAFTAVSAGVWLLQAVAFAQTGGGVVAVFVGDGSDGPLLARPFASSTRTPALDMMLSRN